MLPMASGGVNRAAFEYGAHRRQTRRRIAQRGRDLSPHPLDPEPGVQRARRALLEVDGCHRDYQADVELEHVARLAGEGVPVDDGRSSHVNHAAAGALDQLDGGGREVDVEGWARALIGRHLHRLARGKAAAELIDEVLAL